MESDNLGDQILQEYIKGVSKDDIMSKLNIDDYMYSSWEKINKIELKRIDAILEKKKLCKTLKIQKIPIIESDYEDSDEDVHPQSHHPTKGQFLKKEPKIIHEYAQQINQAMEQKTLESEKLIQLNALKTKYNDLQEKINKLTDLESQKKIGKHEYTRAMSILKEELTNIKNKIKVLEL